MPERKLLIAITKIIFLDEGLVFECIKIRIIKEYDL